MGLFDKRTMTYTYSYEGRSVSAYEFYELMTASGRGHLVTDLGKRINIGLDADSNFQPLLNSQASPSPESTPTPTAAAETPFPGRLQRTPTRQLMDLVRPHLSCPYFWAGAITGLIFQALVCITIWEAIK